MLLATLLLVSQDYSKEYHELRNMSFDTVCVKAKMTNRVPEDVERSRLVRMGRLEYILKIPYKDHKGYPYIPDEKQVRSGRLQPALSTRGNFFRDQPVEYTVMCSAYKPSDPDGGGQHTALGQPVTKGSIAVRTPWFSKLKGSKLWVEKYGYGTVCDNGSFYGKTWVALDLAYSPLGMANLKVIVLSGNHKAWNEYLKLAVATRRK